MLEFFINFLLFFFPFFINKKYTALALLDAKQQAAGCHQNFQPWKRMELAETELDPKKKKKKEQQPAKTKLSRIRITREALARRIGDLLKIKERKKGAKFMGYDDIRSSSPSSSGSSACARNRTIESPPARLPPERDRFLP